MHSFAGAFLFVRIVPLAALGQYRASAVHSAGVRTQRISVS